MATDGTIAVLGTLGNRAMELMTLDRDRGEQPRWSSRTTLGSAWQRRFTATEMHLLEAPGPGGPIETWVASPPGAGDAKLPTVVDVHGGPRGAWAPAHHIEVMLLVARPLPGGIPGVLVERPARSANRPDDPNARLVRPLPAGLGLAL